MDTKTVNKDMRFPISFYHVGVGQGHHFIIAGVHFSTHLPQRILQGTRTILCIKNVVLYAGKVDKVLPGFVTVTSCFEANCRGPPSVLRTCQRQPDAAHNPATK